MSFYCNSLELRHSVCEQSMKESLSTFEDCMKNVHSISSENWWATEQMNQNVELYICTFFNYSQQLSKPASHDWASHKQSWLVLTEVSLFFLSHEYHMKSLQLLEKLKPVWSAKVQYRKLIKLYKRWKKSQSEHRWLWLSLSRYRRKWWIRRQQSYDFKKEDKIWLNLKNIHTDCLCKKFDAKNVKYIIVKRLAHISSVWTHVEYS
jgi:hypothetical protein